MDMRILVTRMLIKNSFMELLKKMPLRKITVTKICEGAQINRVTFYKHYLDPFDLYEKIVAELIDSSAEEMKNQFQNNCLKDAISAVFQNISHNATQYQLLFSENVDDIYKMKSIETGILKLSEINIQIPKISNYEYTSLKIFLSAGGIGILLNWLKHDLKPSAEETAEALYGLICRMMDSYAVKV